MSRRHVAYLHYRKESASNSCWCSPSIQERTYLHWCSVSYANSRNVKLPLGLQPCKVGPNGRGTFVPLFEIKHSTNSSVKALTSLCIPFQQNSCDEASAVDSVPRWPAAAAWAIMRSFIFRSSSSSGTQIAPLYLMTPSASTVVPTRAFYANDCTFRKKATVGHSYCSCGAIGITQAPTSLSFVLIVGIRKTIWSLCRTLCFFSGHVLDVVIERR